MGSSGLRLQGLGLLKFLEPLGDCTYLHAPYTLSHEAQAEGFLAPRLASINNHQSHRRRPCLKVTSSEISGSN